MTSVFTIEENKQNATNVQVPGQFAEAATKLVLAIRQQLDDAEVRSLASNKVASPVLQVGSTSS